MESRYPQQPGLDQTIPFVLLFIRMSVDDPEERTVEVLALPPAVDEELLSLYFENKRRSGGGLLTSLERRDDRVLLVFEEASGKWRGERSVVDCLPKHLTACFLSFFLD